MKEYDQLIEEVEGRLSLERSLLADEGAIYSEEVEFLEEVKDALYRLQQLLESIDGPEYDQPLNIGD